MTTSVLVLLLVFVTLILINVPVAYSLGIASACTLLVNVEFISAMVTTAQRITTGLDSFTLLAIPFFVLAGYLMGEGGLARRLIDFAHSLVGTFPGGLAFVNIFACMMFGAISGSGIATAAAIGSFMHPKMVERGYSPSYSAAVNISSSVNGLIIPPSNVLIVYSLASGGVSIAALFVAGYLPGIMLGLFLMVVAGVMAYKRGYGTEARVPLKEVIKKFGDALLSLTLIVIVIGGIVAGIFTATEAAAIAVIYALILTMGVYREVSFSDLSSIFTKTVVTNAVVMLLIGTSMALSWVLSFEMIPQAIATTLLGLSESKIFILIIMNIILLAVGIFMDMTPAILIFTPLFLPVALELGMNPIHFGIMMVFNLSIGLCTPPVGTVLFAGAGVSGVPIDKIVKPLIPLYLIMIVGLILITYVPEITLFLPNLFGLN